MRTTKLLQCTFGLILILVGTCPAAIAQVPTPNAAFAPGAFDHFDFYGRCTNTHLAVDDRIRYCKEMLNTGRSDSISGVSALADLYVKTQDYPDALIFINKLLINFSDSRYSNKAFSEPRVYTLGQRAVIYSLMGRFDDAMTDATEIMNIDGEESDAYNQRCWIRAVSGRELDKALEDCNHAISLKPKAANILDSRGVVYLKTANFDAARADFEAELHEFPKYAGGLYELGVIERRQGNAAAGDGDIAKAENIDASIALQMAAYGITP